MIQMCMCVCVDYRVVGKMGEGTFSEVLKCQSHVDGKLYACKKMKQKYERYILWSQGHSSTKMIVTHAASTGFF